MKVEYTVEAVTTYKVVRHEISEDCGSIETVAESSTEEQAEKIAALLASHN